MSFFSNIRADAARYIDIGGWYGNLGFWVTLLYRFGSWASRMRPRILGFPFLVLYRLSVIPVRFFLHVYLPAQTVIGEGFRLPHPHLILIPPGSKLGINCTIYHNVTLGHGSSPGVPKLADNVVVFSGAKILGGTRIGEYAHIGVNTVVMRDIASGVMVSAPLCRSIPMNMAENLLKSQNKQRTGGKV